MNTTLLRSGLRFGLLVGLLAGWSSVPAQAQSDEGLLEGDTYEGEWIDEQAAAEPWSPEDQPPAEVDINYFFDKLAPYGEWIWTPEHGWVWKPSGTSSDWRPYTHGHWEYTEHGWTWVSDFPWGWAPFHYGRWAYLDHIAWVWVPGTVWGPAWVTWRYSGVYVGWSPLLAGFDWWYGWAYYPVFYSHWTFVNWGHFCHRHVHHHAVGRHRSREIFRHTSYPRRCRDAAGPACNRGPSHQAVERVTQKRIPVRRIENLAANVRSLRKAKPDPQKLGLAGDQLRIYRPQLAPAKRQLDPSIGTNGRAIRPTVDLGEMRPASAAGARPVSGAARRPDGPLSELPGSDRRPSPGATIHPQRPSRPGPGSSGSGLRPMPTGHTYDKQHKAPRPAAPAGYRPAQPSRPGSATQAPSMHRPSTPARTAPSVQRPSQPARSYSPPGSSSSRPSPSKPSSASQPSSSSRSSPASSSRSSGSGSSSGGSGSSSSSPRRR